MPPRRRPPQAPDRTRASLVRVNRSFTTEDREDSDDGISKLSIPEADQESDLMGALSHSPNSRASRFQNRLLSKLGSEVSEQVRSVKKSLVPDKLPDIYEKSRGAGGTSSSTPAGSSALDAFSKKGSGDASSGLGGLMSRLKSGGDSGSDSGGSQPSSPLAGKGGGWKSVKTKLQTTQQIKSVFKEKEMTKSDKRNSYVASVLPGIRDQSHIKCERCLLSHKDILFLKKYFDSFDLDGDGTVTLKEVCAVKDKNKVMRKFDTELEDNVEKIILTMNKDMTFQDLLMMTYPDLTKADLGLVNVFLKSKQPTVVEEPRRSSLEVKRQTEEEKFHAEMMEVKQHWDLNRNPLGVITMNAFASILRQAGEDLTPEELKERYKKEANPQTGKMNKKDFTKFFLNMYRKSPLKWADVQPKIDEFWKQNPDVDKDQRR